MSVDFGCIETCIFPDFEDYVWGRGGLFGLSAWEWKWRNTRSRWSLATTRSVYVKFKQKCLIK